MFLNQLRQKIGVTFGSPETTTGGNALKFYASMRFDVRRIGQVKVGDEPVGGRTRVKVAKNKCAPPFTRGRVRDPLGHGRRLGDASCSTSASRAGLVDKAGNHLSFAGSPLGNGRERSRDTLGGERRAAEHAAAGDRRVGAGAAGEAGRSGGADAAAGARGGRVLPRRPRRHYSADQRSRRYGRSVSLIPLM